MAQLSQGLETIDGGSVGWREIINDNLVTLNGGIVAIVGLASARVATPGAGDPKWYYATDTNVLSVYTGGTWVQVNATTIPTSVTLAQITASSTAGIAIKDSAGTTVATIGAAGTTAGNARGTNAIDWQASRLNAAQVASGANSSISGGSQNTASGAGAHVGGGDNNTASGVASTVAGGAINTASALNSTVGGGDNNTASGVASTVAGGGTGTASGLHATVGGGLNSVASGDYATVPGGRGCTAYNYAETVLGRWATISAGNQTGITTADRIFAVGNGTGTGSRSNALQVFGDGDVEAGRNLSAVLLERTPILPPWDDAANPGITAGDSGGTFAFSGTASLPDATTLPEGWEVTLMFGSGASASSAGGDIIDPTGNFSSTAIFENGFGRAVLRIICDGNDYIAASVTGTLANV